MLIVWLEFIFCSGIIVFCGTKLSVYGDIIAEKTRLGWDAIAIFIAYLVNIYLLYSLRGRG